MGTEFFFFFFFMVEMARFERTERPVIKSILAKTSEDGFQEFNLFCYRWIVYS